MCLYLGSQSYSSDVSADLPRQHLSEPTSVNRPSSIDVYRGFCALHDVMTYIVNSVSSAGNYNAHFSDENDDEALPSKLMSSSHHISSIGLPYFHLEVMEDVFSLLFSRIEHLKDSEDSPDCQTDSEPENADEDMASRELEKFVFDAAELNTSAVETPHEIPPVENPRVGALAAESRSSPQEASSSSHEGRSDELSGSQTVSNSSLQSANESGFLVQDYVVRNVLLLLQGCCEELKGESAQRCLLLLLLRLIFSSKIFLASFSKARGLLPAVLLVLLYYSTCKNRLKT